MTHPDYGIWFSNKKKWAMIAMERHRETLNALAKGSLSVCKSCQLELSNILEKARVHSMWEHHINAIITLLSGQGLPSHATSRPCRSCPPAHMLLLTALIWHGAHFWTADVTSPGSSMPQIVSCSTPMVLNGDRRPWWRAWVKFT